MKRMYFGTMLFVSGLIGILFNIYLSIKYPTIHVKFTPDGDLHYDHLKGFLLEQNLMFLFILFVLATLIGLVICGIEAFEYK